jgi:hypothetical protein
MHFYLFKYLTQCYILNAVVHNKLLDCDIGPYFSIPTSQMQLPLAKLRIMSTTLSHSPNICIHFAAMRVA